MGQKVNPIGFRLGITRTWDSRWFAKKDYSRLLHEDIKLREHLKGKLHGAGIARIEIERAANKVKINVHTARPGIVIGKKGAGVESLKGEVQKLSKNEIFLNIIEVKKPEANATLIAENVASQLEKRVAFRRESKVSRFVFLDVWVVLKLLVPNGTAKTACLCILSEQTLITAPLKHALLMV